MPEMTEMAFLVLNPEGLVVSGAESAEHAQQAARELAQQGLASMGDEYGATDATRTADLGAWRPVDDDPAGAIEEVEG
jgi:hypothetical protein